MVDVVLSWPAWARAQRGLGASARACLRELASLLREFYFVGHSADHA